MTTLLLYDIAATGTVLPGEITPRPDEHGNGPAGPRWRLYGSGDPALAALLRQAELQDRRAFERAYLLTDDGRVLTARMRATVEDDQRLIWFGPFFDDEPGPTVGTVVVSWPVTHGELGDRG